MPTLHYPAAGRHWSALWQTSFWLACLALLATSPVTARAQSADNPSLVLVLNVFSDTHVKPVTGVVLSTDGLVMVPASFISEGDRVVVLDGGFDLEQNARRGRIIARSAEAGLALLMVDGLQRPAMTITQDPTPDIAGLRLQAWPPAEQLADSPSLLTQSTTPDLPNLSGPLLNTCGQMAGVHLAIDTPGLQPVEGDRTLNLDELIDGLANLAVDVERAWCRYSATPEAGTAPASTHSSGSSELEVLDEQGRPLTTPSLAQQTSAPSPSRPEPSGRPMADEAVTDIPVSSPEQDLQPADGAPSMRPPETIPEPDPSSSLLWMAGMSLAGILFAVWLILNIRRSSPSASEDGPHSTESPGPPIRIGVHIDHDGQDPLFWVESLSAGRKEYDIGALGADIEIDDPSILRRHARLWVSGDQLAIGSVDNRAGLWVNGLPCLEGEMMIIGSDDQIILGRIHCRFEMAPSE